MIFINVDSHESDSNEERNPKNGETPLPHDIYESLSNDLNEDCEIVSNKNTSPEFEVKDSISKDDFLDEVDKAFKPAYIPEHEMLTDELLDEIQPMDFHSYCGIKDISKKPSKTQLVVAAIEGIINTAKDKSWDMGKSQQMVFTFNGRFWKQIDADQFTQFLGKAAEKMGFERFNSRHYSTREQLFKQFMGFAFLPITMSRTGKVLLNLKNGTLEVNKGTFSLRPPAAEDFIKYVLPFDYNPNAAAPLFFEFLNEVLPDKTIQSVLAEFLGYTFVDNQELKLDKALMLYGSGANGKSVIFDIVNALFGPENVSNYSMQNLTNDNGYFRAMIANKLLNYCSELSSSSIEHSYFKKLSSGEAVMARLPYTNPYTIDKYARLIFNCNTLPKDTEQTHAYFRRFLIIPFDVTIPEEMQDKSLAKKIIDTELAGVFNWILEGLKRLLANRRFTHCEAVENQTEQYRKNSDSVLLFLDEEQWVKSTVEFTALKDLYSYYKNFCLSSGYHACSSKTFSERLRKLEYKLERKNTGNVVYATCTLQVSMFDM